MKKGDMSTNIKPREGELLTRAGKRISIGPNVDLYTSVLEAEQAAGESRGRVALIVHPRELRDLGVKERSPSRVSNPRGPKRDASDYRACREIEFHE